MSKDRRLGRGLAALLGTPLEAEVVAQGSPVASGHGTYGTHGTDAAAHTLTGLAAASPEPRTPNPEPSLDLLQLPLAEIEENPFQPRREFSEPEILSLAASLKEHDLLQPILVRRVNGRYQRVGGERRLRAAKHAGWTTIPARVRVADDRLVAELAIVENLQRKDLNPVEKALSFKRYLDEHRCTQDDLAKHLKIDRSTIANLMRLLELPDSILSSLSKGTLTAGHARHLLPLGDEHEQVALAERIEQDGLSVRDVERLVAEKIGHEDDAEESAATISGPNKQPRTRTDQIASLEQEFRHALGTKVEIRATSRGRGKITIHFANHDEFDRLREQLTDATPGSATRKAA